MEIEKVIEKKECMLEDIKEIVALFNRETGCMVVNINCDYTHCESDEYVYRVDSRIDTGI